MRSGLKAFIGAIATLIILGSPVCYGLDTDLYVLSGRDIPPNVLVILDSSASMDEVVSGSDADYQGEKNTALEPIPGIDYGALLTPPAVTYPRYAVYYKTAANRWNLWTLDYRADPRLNTDACLKSELKVNLEIYGHAENNTCEGGSRDYQTGNYRNFLQISGPGGSRSRFGLANGVIHSYVDTVSGVRFGAMAFNRDSLGNVVKYDPAGIYKEYVTGGGDPKDDPFTTPLTPWDAIGGQVLGFVDEFKNGKTSLFGKLASLKNDSWSPLAETLTDAGIYLQTGKDALGKPIVQYPCQKLYVLIISDGFPTKDTGKLDDVAKSLFNLDLTNGTYHTPQNIKTYTIGFSVDDTLLKETARVGGGKYFYVYSSQSFNIAFQTFIADVLDYSTSYVAPVVPISQMESFRSSDRMFLAMFKPTWTSFWKGNLKKFGIAEKNESPILIGDILDKTGKLALDPSTNAIKKESISYWNDTVDGGEVEAGGVGEVLLKRTAPRKIYTHLEGNPPTLTDPLNAFSKDNGAITASTLGLAADDITGREKIINFIHGLDSYDENRNGLTDKDNEKRDWILGAFIHSRPVVVHYVGRSDCEDRSVIYAGANDGMLHAFDNGVPLNEEKTEWDDGTGDELWAFIPRNFLSSLKNLNGEALEFFVDGAPKAYIKTDALGNLTRAILIFGMRRGGNHYIALDVTNYKEPFLLWDISPTSLGYGELGQTWSTPNLGRINDGSPSGKWVAFFGGGYDENQDLASPLDDKKGRAIYVVDIEDGRLIWSYSYGKDPRMRYCIPSDIARVDTNGDGTIDRLYVGDMGGQMWRFDIGDSDTLKWTGKIVFDSNPGLSLKRKIFYPPDVTLEKGNYEMLFFGTGNREAPKDKTVFNRLYGVKDKNLAKILTENDLFDVTGVEATFQAVDAMSGWYIRLEDVGEKSLSTSVLFSGAVYYTTFTPVFGESGDICFLGEGTARLYALRYKTGYAALDLDHDGTISPLGDRSTIMGVEDKSTIPSAVIITFVGGKAVAYAGIGGGVYIPPLPNTRTIIPINWRIKF